jgi:hypothetical protein
MQSLSVGSGDEVRLGRGFMFWGVTMTLTEEGLSHVPQLLRAVHQGLHVIRSTPYEQQAAIYAEIQQVGLDGWRVKGGQGG